jgi:hypothetical protein
MNVHVERARQIADALESQDVEQTLHEQFVAEWKAWEAEDPTRTMAAFDRAIGRGNDYTGRLVRFVTGSATSRTSPFYGNEEGRRKDRATAARVIREQPEVIAEFLDEEPEVHARILDAVEERRQRTASPPAPRPDRGAAARIEHGWERVYYAAKDQLKRMQDVAAEDPDHLCRVFSNIRDVIDLAERALGSDDFAEVEEWLTDAS